jgi:hypothetical protein
LATAPHPHPSYTLLSGSPTAIDRSEPDHPGQRAAGATQEMAMSLGLILLIVVVLMLVGAIPAWPHSRGWGYGPSGGLGLVLLILLVLLLMGRI